MLISKINNFFESIGKTTLFILRILGGTATGKVPLSLFLEHVVEIGINSVFVVFLITFFTGMVMSLQISSVLESLLRGISQFTGMVVSLAMVKELAPMLASLVLAGRIGSSVCAELGTMVISEQIAALKTLNTNPIDYLVSPRLWAVIIVLPILSLFGDVMGIMGGGVVSAFVERINPFAYYERVVDGISLLAIAGGLIKSSVFGAIIILVAGRIGLSVKGGAVGVGHATTKSVVISFILILGFDYPLTLILSNFGM